jgi:hypothetical protein
MKNVYLIALFLLTPSQGREKGIVIRNHRPQHSKAESYYPASLGKLLARVSELRPKD